MIFRAKFVLSNDYFLNWFADKRRASVPSVRAVLHVVSIGTFFDLLQKLEKKGISSVVPVL